MEGFLLIDKPNGITSHDVVARVRRATGEKRVGHAGTLDPFATGLLIVGVGRVATREMEKLSGLDKSYEAVVTLGGRSDTDDRTGTLSPGSSPAHLSERDIDNALAAFHGEIDQIPPSYAAIKIGGKKMYEAAREGNPLEAPPRHVRIDECVRTSPLTTRNDRAFVSLRISCSSGTYIRAIARDLGSNLGVGGYLEELRRTRIGPFLISNATPPPARDGSGTISLIPVTDLLAQLGP